ncbi:MAG: DUF4446 family protein [Lachnospiraceae bacterium]|jgi:hypothetical protein|nr:DUF4446 family protein [Lachnospiraceae bacterium]MCI9389636.1 DUF4446 family protein [Lachnospiraceae bacterium]MCI9470354.1 DUF4446 family protein [Lachnospiraceae bacterium]
MNDFFTNVGIDPAIVILILAVFLVILFLVVFRMSSRLRKLEKKYRGFMKGKDGQSLEKLFVHHFRNLEKLVEAMELHDQRIDILRKNYTRLFSKYGVEKYDAFDDVGGKMSFVLALLDKNNTGVILNAIHSRDNCFLYLKEIVKGESYVMLSQEEVEALRKAVNFGLAENMENGTD